MHRLRITLLLLALIGLSAYLLTPPSGDRRGCDRYLPMPGMALVAHAGGGLPEGSYANSVRALDTSYANGHRRFEIDLFHLPLLGLRAGHDLRDAMAPGAMDGATLLDWLRDHRDAVLFTDIKTDNRAGLSALAALAGDLKPRIVPQIYQPDEFEPVARLGYARPVFALYRNEDPDWLRLANSGKVQAVAIPLEKAHLAGAITAPVFLHTVNSPMPRPGIAGLYTDCLVPAPAG